MLKGEIVAHGGASETGQHFLSAQMSRLATSAILSASHSADLPVAAKGARLER
jgi:hypothetical protein